MLNLAPREGIFTTSLANLSVIRSDRPTVPQLVLYEPALCIVAQGVKEAQLETRTYRYDASHYLLGSACLPVMGAVVEGSERKPFLCLRVELDRAVVAELIENVAPEKLSDSPCSALNIGVLNDQLLDAVVRLLELTTRPLDRSVLAPLIEREIVWYLLNTSSGAVMLAQMVRRAKNYRTLYDTLAWLEKHFAESSSCQDLAGRASMSQSKFYSQFKALTGTSPIRYRARLRLIEARRLMVVDGFDAASAGFKVGYNEPSQFSREYSSYFGLPPKRDVERLLSSEGDVSVLFSGR
nr:AraC family transcriptional regulator [Microbulbifer elongatus]